MMLQKNKLEVECILYVYRLLEHNKTVEHLIIELLFTAVCVFLSNNKKLQDVANHFAYAAMAFGRTISFPPKELHQASTHETYIAPRITIN